MNRHRVDDEDSEETNGDGHWERGPASVKFVWVKGHAKDEGNNAADQLAVAAAREAKAIGASY
jgi:ribonuclease HI